MSHVQLVYDVTRNQLPSAATAAHIRDVRPSTLDLQTLDLRDISPLGHSHFFDPERDSQLCHGTLRYIQED